MALNFLDNATFEFNSLCSPIPEGMGYEPTLPRLKAGAFTSPARYGGAYHVAVDVKDLFLKQKAAIRARTDQAVALIRPEHMDWRPEPGALTVGEMLQHLWVSEEGVRGVALNGDFAYYATRIPQGLRATLSARSLEENLANLSRVHNETLAAVRALPLEKFEEEQAHEGLGFRRKIGIILFGINEHEIHHRAQLMTYMRMLGTPVAEAVQRR